VGAGLYALFSNFLCRLYDFADGILGGKERSEEARLARAGLKLIAQSKCNPISESWETGK